jgi:pimeloyl-ACP methyl ester carboxylesterase
LRIKLHMMSTTKKEQSMKRLFLCMFLAAVCMSFAWAQVGPGLQIVEDSLIMTKIPMRSGSTVDLHAKIFENISSNCQAGIGNTVVAIHGMWHTANTWRNLAYALLDNSQDVVWDGAMLSGNICRFVALDLPGHGRSSYPTGGSLTFGDLVAEDYVGAIFAGMDRLRAINIRPTILISHSIGGLLIEMMQDTLIKQGKDRLGREINLRSAYGIRNVVLLNPAPPGGFPWGQVDNPAALAAFQSYIFMDPRQGMYILPDYIGWISFMFGGADGKLSPSTPSASEVALQQYISPEPLSILLQAANFGPLRRPSVAPGIFTPFRGTKIQMVVGENDAIFKPTENEAVYRYLTYDNSKARYVVVDGPESVHDLYIGNAGLLLKRISGQIVIPNVVGDDIEP